VAETADWKEKYQQALRQFAADEKRWQSLETLLRRIVSRVSTAPLGLDDNLDHELTRLSASIRRQGGVEELEPLFATLSRAIEAFEQQSNLNPKPSSPTVSPAAASAATPVLRRHNGYTCRILHGAP
jgi:hypothetical protein